MHVVIIRIREKYLSTRVYGLTSVSGIRQCTAGRHSFITRATTAPPSLTMRTQ